MQVTKRCTHCGIPFQSEIHWNKRYCSHKCYQTAKVYRRAERDKAAPVQPNLDDARFVTILHYPTPERLKREILLLDEGEYIKVVGMNHMWTPPEDVTFTKQIEQENFTDVWVLSKGAPVPDIVKQILGR